MAVYTSLFKKDDVRITTPFSSSHKGIDLSRGVVRQPIYLPNRAVEGEVWKVLVGYESHGVFYKDAPIVYVKHKNGSGSRYIHSALEDVKVKVGDKLKAGDRICSTGSSGYTIGGDHLHFEWLTKWDDLNTRVDPAPYVINDKEGVETFKIGDKIEFTGVQNIRKGSGTSYKVTGETKIGDVYEIEDGPRYADGYTWYDLKGSDWVADVGKFKKYEKPVIPPVTPPDAPDCSEYQKRIDMLSAEIAGLKLALGATENEKKLAEERVAFLEEAKVLQDREVEEIMKENETLREQRNEFERQYQEAVTELNALKHGKESLWERISKLLKQIFGR